MFGRPADLMRLTKKQNQLIVTQIHQAVPDVAQIILFGSRVDDTLKGGDIDLLIEMKGAVKNPIDIITKIAARLYIALEQKVDVLLMASNLRQLAIHKVAKDTGVVLK